MNEDEIIEKMRKAFCDAAYHRFTLPDGTYTEEVLIDDGMKAAFAIAKKHMGVKWQTIDSTPKDGTEIIVFSSGKLCANVHWSFSKNMNGEVIPSAFDCWAYDGCGGMSYTPNAVYGEPTHWMPLPDAPEFHMQAGGE